MPTKLINRNINLSYTLRRFKLIGGIWVLQNQGSGVSSGWSGMVGDNVQRTWDNTPGWKAFRTSYGYLPTRHMHEYQVRFTQTDFGRVVTNDGIWRVEQNSAIQFTVASSYPGYITYGAADMAGLMSPVKTKVLAKARDMKVNVAVAFGEGRQTTRMIAQTAQRLGKAYSAFRKGRFKKAAKELGLQPRSKEAANHWLEYSYGWMPLISDVVGMAELAAQHLALGGRPPRFRVSSRSIVNTSTTSLGGVVGSYDYVTYRCRRRHQWKYECRAGLLLEVNYSASALAAQTGFGLTDVSLLAWELTPFSFVFDWFVDIGGWLEGMSALQGLTVLAGFESFSESCYTQHRLENWKINNTLAHPEQGMSYFEDTQRWYTRDPWLGSLPSITTSISDALNARRIVTTASLWRQRTSGDRLPGAYRP